MLRYRASVKSEQPPHIYALADFTYQAMLHDLENQYIVISGESGSGKTQSANFLVKQLTFLGNAPNKRLQEKILQINPLIEGFGNARTIINDNSSRFGKYLEMLFTKQGRVTGARLSEYLLEKTRVVNQGRAERNFHIFYYLFHGLASSVPNDPNAFYLSTTQTYRYLSTGLQDDHDLCESFKSKFAAIEKCFEIIGFQPDEVKSIYRILAGLLHLGNINFHQNEGHFIDGKTCLTDRHLLQVVGELFGIDIAEFDLALTTCNIVTRGETIQRSTTLQESQSTRDAMAKACSYLLKIPSFWSIRQMSLLVYNRLFSWIVNRISALLAPSTIASALPTQNILSPMTDDESSKHSVHNYNTNNNNNHRDESSDREMDEPLEDEHESGAISTVITTYPPQTMMYAMKRTLDFLEMTPLSSACLFPLDGSDDDDLLNTNNNNNNNNNNNHASNAPSPPTHPAHHQATNLINDLNNHSPAGGRCRNEDKPIKNLIENWSKVVAAAAAASSTTWAQVMESKQSNNLFPHRNPPSHLGRLNLTSRATSETNLALRKKTVENNVKKHYQSSNNLCVNNKQAAAASALILPLLPSIKQEASSREILHHHHHHHQGSSLIRTININVSEPLKHENDCDALRIAILDIFGFENFSTNTFEQLCINIANEQIQYYFNQHVFACERQEYINENLSVLPLPAKMDFTFYDNRPLLDMFLNKPVSALELLRFERESYLHDWF